MSPEEPDAGGLAEFRDRLRGGICAAVADSRPADLDFRDAEGLRGWPGHALDALETIRGDSWGGDGEPDATINALTERMRNQPPFLTAVLFSPPLVLNRLLESQGSSPKGLVNSWIGMCWTAEAAWHAVADDLPAAAVYAAGQAELLRPLAARLRFLVLSEPSRWRAEDDGWWARVPDRIPGGNRVLNRAFGPRSWHVLITRAAQARRGWQGFLDAYESHPLLSQARPDQLEMELRSLLFRHTHPGPAGWLTPPLGLSVNAIAESAPLTAEDKAIIAEAADRHLLPRFALPAMIRLAFIRGGRRGKPAPRRIAAALAGLTAAAGLTAVGLAAGLRLHQAAIAAAVCYLLIVIGVLSFGSGWASIWLLRMPAASAVGVIALVAFLPGGWLTKPPDGGLAILALAGASFGYLAVEVRNHGAAPWVSLRRALMVWAVGTVHALMVSLIGLVVVAPAFVTHGRALAALWGQPGYRVSGVLLALATAWCLAVGVFSQILWDDRPITAPLAHLSWRSRLPLGGTMAWTTVTLQVTTPLFNGGADPDDSAGFRPDREAGIRVASIRGAMRFWFRALAGPVAGLDLNLLSALERHVFGDAGNASPVLLRISRQPQVADKSRRYFLEGEAGRWITYLLGQGLTSYDRDSRRFLLTRSYVDAGQSFDVKLRFADDEVGALALGSLRLCCLYGGFGARTRRGFGGVQIVRVDGTLPEPWSEESLSSRGLRDYAGVRALWPAGELESCRKLLAGLRAGLAPAAESSFDDTWTEPPPYPVLSRSRTVVGVSGEAFTSWPDTLRHAGQQLRHFRANRPNTNPAARYQPKIETQEWAEVVHRQDAHHFPLGALGLPVVYKDDCVVNVDRGSGSGAEKLRRASPLWIRAVGSGENWRLLSFAFLGQFLPGPDAPGVHLWRGNVQAKALDVADQDLESLARQWISELRSGRSFLDSARRA